ncbi:PTS sugar transporter subunit IIC [Longibaculum muris]|uniref:PTS sugar transporter subunit IIC n=1 Tax=Longibaculum muris TaxID=1796628 RepID=UPI00189F7623|nr:PTS transporter subunit EIIC [Longibaculum muris]
MMDKISNLLLPIAEKLSKNKYLSAIRDGFVSIMPLVLTASLFTLINCVFVGKGNYLDKWFGMPCTGFAQIGGVIGSASMSVMAILLVFTTSKALASQYKMDTSITGAVAVVSFLCLTPFVSDAKLGEYVTTYYLGAAGMFTAFISAIVSVELLRFLMSFKALLIKMPESVPTGIARSFNSIIPVALTVIIFALLRIVTDAMGAPLNDLIFTWIQTPFTAIVSSPIGMIIIYILYMLLWGFGIHSAYIFNPILEPIYLVSLTANATAIAAHQSATAIITKPFLDSVAFMGGAGNMLALVIAIFIVSKRQDYKVIAKLGFAPALFNISEPLMFGLPVVMNPILIIPMILTTLAGLGIGALATQIGLMAHTYVLIPWTTPPVISAFLATGGDILSGVVGLVILVISILIYIPFVKVMDKEAQVQIEE